ncbi:MAG: septum formation initiator family protein [Candidatus Kapabacteria bacterium]|nr:septum formation initiator family protein [Candidatus Kapabacteria bacterium]
MEDLNESFREINTQTENTEENKRLELSRWTWFMLISIIAVLTVLYVNSVFKVNSILADINQQEMLLESLKNNNYLLISQAEKLQSADRICKIAEASLGLVRNDKIPEELRQK